MNKKFSMSIRIDNVSPAHVTVSLFSNLVLKEYPHVDITRARAGELVFTVDEFFHFLLRSSPDLVSLRNEKDKVKLREHAQVELLDFEEGFYTNWIKVDLCSNCFGKGTLCQYDNGPEETRANCPICNGKGIK